MPGEQRLLVRARTEFRPQELVYKAQARIQQRAVAGRTVISDRALEQMPDTVKLVAMLLRLWFHALGGMVQHVVRVQVTVRLLGGHNLMNILVHCCAELRPVARLQRESRCLNPLVNIRVRIDGTTLLCRAVSGQPSEIIHAPVDFQQLAHRRNAGAHVRLAARRPESALNSYGMHRNGAQLGVRRLRQIQNSLVAPRRIRAERNRILLELTRTNSIPKATQKTLYAGNRGNCRSRY